MIFLKKDKQSKISKLLVKFPADGQLSKSDQKELEKKYKAAANAVSTAIFGYKTKIEDIFNLEIPKEDKKDWEFKFTDTDADDKLAALSEKLTEKQQTVIAIVEELFGAITLSEL
jgi:CRISPR-associated endonuclease Csn1